MLLKDIFENALKNSENSHFPDIEEFASALGMDSVEWTTLFESRVKGYWVAPSYCTDEYVGMAVYFIDDKPLAVSMKTGRTSPTTYEFYSHEAAKSCINYILELQGKQEYKYQIANLDEDHKDNVYHVRFGANLLDETGYYKGKKVKVIQKFTGANQVSNWTHVIVEDETGVQTQIDLKDFDIPYVLK